jgi:hypothetical protein
MPEARDVRQERGAREPDGDLVRLGVRDPAWYRRAGAPGRAACARRAPKARLVEDFLERANILGLDAGDGWLLAARLWANARALRPTSETLTDCDVLIAATAALHGHDFVTADEHLATVLGQLAFPVAVHLLPIA